MGGLDNKGQVSAKGADNLVVGNTINSGKVLLAAKTGKIDNVENLAGAEVVIESGTWQFDGPTSNKGVVHVKGGKFTGNVKENAGTIIIESGVTGKVLICKQTGSGKIENKGQGEVSIDSGAAFCSQEVPKPISKPAPPALFYCRNAAKYAKTIYTPEKTSENKTCGQIINEHIKIYWDVVKQELDSPSWKNFYSTCCDPAITPPKGKFEQVFIKKANAKSGKFSYTKVDKVNRRRLA